MVQLDSDESLDGRVTPDVRVPVTMETMRAAFLEKPDVVITDGIRTLQELLSPSRGGRTSP